MALLAKGFSLAARRLFGRPCYISSLPSLQPELPVEELENRHFGPWLMFVHANNDNDETISTDQRRCYSFLSDKTFSLSAPQLKGRRCWGNQHGWLVTLGLDRQMHLFNPLTQQQLSLPSQQTFKIRQAEKKWWKGRKRYRCTFFIRKVCLSSHPDHSPSPPVVMCSYGKYYLGFASPGDKSWKSLKFKPVIDWNNVADEPPAYMDLIFYEGQFYAVDTNGNLSVCDLTTDVPKLHHIASFSTGVDDYLYLVNISGHLHMICRKMDSSLNLSSSNVNIYIYRTTTESFALFRFDFHKTEWIGVEHLNGQSLFVGNNTAFAISASDYPRIKPNCIYFTDDVNRYFLEPDSDNDYWRGVCDMGVYDFANKTFLERFKGEGPLSKICPPFFFLPSL